VPADDPDIPASVIQSPDTVVRSRSRTSPGWPLFAYSFRPFFLLAALQSGPTVVFWLVTYYHQVPIPTTFIPLDWHIHEMLFGFLPAVVTGFLFTAIPNWTGRLPIRGAPLVVLALVWLAGRFAVTFSEHIGWITALVVDAAFLTLFAAAATREIIAGANWRNLRVISLVVALLIANIWFHLESHFNGNADYSLRFGISAALLLICLIGGRIIPSFTRNWLARENPGRLPAPFGRIDAATLALSAAVLLAWVIAPASPVTGVGMALAGIAHIVRLARWAGDRTGRERLVIILHIAYAFVPLGFLLTAASVFTGIQASAGIHAWMAGAAGTMTLAVMTRASLGHCGQALRASVATQVIYGAIVVAALARIAAALMSGPTKLVFHIAAFGWAIAFLGFAVAYGPMLVGTGWRALAIPRPLNKQG